MAQNIKREKRYRWIGISVVAVALLGWLLALYLWSALAEKEGELDRQVSLSGQAGELENRVAALQSEATQAEANRDQGISEFSGLQQRLDVIREDVAAAEIHIGTLNEERQTLETEVADRREAQVRLQEDIARAQQEVTATSLEFSEVGERLEQARRQEAELQSRISDLTSDDAELTEDASGAEDRVQTAREAEASLEQQVATARRDLEEMQTARNTVEQSVAALVQRRDQLAVETAEAEGHMNDIQGQIVELSRDLAERSERLTELQIRIADVQEETGRRARAAASGILFNELYEYGPVAATFFTEGGFEMVNGSTGEALIGDYSLTEGLLTLSRATGDLGEARFPMRCNIIAEAAGFRLQDEDGSCEFLSGISFSRVSR